MRRRRELLEIDHFMLDFLTKLYNKIFLNSNQFIEDKRNF